MKCSIYVAECDESLINQVNTILEELGIENGDNKACRLNIKAGDASSIKKDNGGILITYKRRCEAFRLLSMLKRFITEDSEEIRQSAKYSMLCYMIDESRNAVTNVKEVKRLVRLLALNGFDSLMLYTEDTFELPGYKYFGYQRGKYTVDELRELDEYADSYGIELIPCIQMLAHLKGALRWPDFAGYRDDADTLLVGDERTYAYARAVLEVCKRCFKTNKIHIGMDEAVNLGRGQYLTKNGYRPSTDIMEEHTKKILDLCREYGYSPMMWSDTIFREALGQYYISEGNLTEEMIAKIPKDTGMVYWDYYHDDEKLLDNMMKLHKQTGAEVIFAGGSRKWDGFATNNSRSLVCSEMQLKHCDKHNVEKIILTAWGDCGGEASIYSALSGIVQYAEICYGESADTDSLNRRSLECFGADFDTIMAFDLPNKLPGASWNYTTAAKYLLFNDPFERIMDMHLDKGTVSEWYAECAKILYDKSDNPLLGYALKTLAALSDALSIKCDLGWRIYDAYAADDKAALKEISASIPVLIEKIRYFLDLFREQWYRENKTAGFIVQEYRIGGLMERLRSVKERLDSFIAGRISSIDELMCEPLPLLPDHSGKYIGCNAWETFVSAANWE